MWRIFRVVQKGCVVRDIKAKSSVLNVSGVDAKPNCERQHGRTICISADQIDDSYNSQFSFRVLRSEVSQQEYGNGRGARTCFHEEHQTLKDQKDEVDESDQKEFSSSTNQFKGEEESSDGQSDQKTGFKWNDWTRSYYHDVWSGRHPCHILEAIGWGTAILSGFRISHLFKSSKLRNEEPDRCWLHQVQRLAASVLKEHFFQLETGYYSTTSTVKSVLPRGVFSSLPLPSSVAFQDDTQVSASKASSSTITSYSFESRVSDLKVFKVDSVFPEVRVADSSTAVKDISLAAAAASNRHSEVGFDEESRIWKETVRTVAAAMNNAEGVRSAHSGDLEEAVKFWKKAVDEADYTKAHFNLGMAYEQGIGVEKDLKKALYHYSSAIEKYHPASMFNSAMIHLRRQSDVERNTKIAIDLLERAAEFGLKEAQRELGVLYTEPPNADMVRAAGLFKKATSQEDTKATYFLGICYENGWGVSRNESTAATLYQRAAAAGHPDAQYNLGQFFETGKGGLVCSKHKAMELYKAACACGCAKAAERLKSLQTSLVKEEMEDSFSGTGAKFPSVSHAKIVPSKSLAAPPRSSFFFRPRSSYDSDAMSHDSFSEAEFSDISESSSEEDSLRYERSSVKMHASNSAKTKRVAFGGKDSLRSGLFLGFSSDEDESSASELGPRRNASYAYAQLI